MKRAVLSKLWAWIILAVLALVDTFIDMIFANNSGLQGFFWNPVARLFGIKYAPLAVPLVLGIFWIIAKLGALLESRMEKTPMAEELVLTTMVIGYGLFDLWLVLVYGFGFSLFSSHLQLIPIIVVAASVYAWLAEKELKKGRKK